MLFIFGKAFVCSSLDIAKKIAFDPQVRVRCVTFDGDVVDPNGTLAGGYVEQRNQLLKLQMEVRKRQNELKDLFEEQDELLEQ